MNSHQRRVARRAREREERAEELLAAFRDIEQAMERFSDDCKEIGARIRSERAYREAGGRDLGAPAWPELPGRTHLTAGRNRNRLNARTDELG